MGLIPISLVLFLHIFGLIVSTSPLHAQAKVFNVVNYGAKANDKTDNSAVFLKVWNAACEEEGKKEILIPAGVFRTGPVKMNGPCKGQMLFNNRGVLRAPSDPQLQVREWITFQYIDGLTVHGLGTFDGQGAYSWSYKKTSKYLVLPDTLRFHFVNNSMVHHLRLIDSKGIHMMFYGCYNIYVDHIHISAPGDSPNTDGIHIALSSNIHISYSTIGTGDDCIALLSGARNVNVSHVNCGPGHGISVGSLGNTQGEEDVTGLLVQSCMFTGTLNGVRIKTWANPSFPLTASSFTFQDLIMNNVYNPIIIDQEYSDLSTYPEQGSSQVQIRDVKYINIRGNSMSQVAINFLCSEFKPCQNLELNNINLDYHGRGGPAKADCTFANGVAYGTQNPPSCL
ncbi:Glycoside hydrolase, family 28 [Dillenia turbinata]|uniref:Glycoside hydrolase, family 28 n=1 Tax=Dillenia turbinata TaxID=194707 RepID=A0AAN8YYR4_9MAGN